MGKFLLMEATWFAQEKTQKRRGTKQKKKKKEKGLEERKEKIKLKETYI